jgi:formylglycine-generating enzyme required for sulfatase activity
MPIFISYSSKDQKSAEAICTAIEHRGFECWISSRDIGPGENFQTQVVRAIRRAQVMVLVFSSNANNSEEIKKELVLAGQSRLVVIPVRVEDVAPDEAFAYEFATRQWIDVFGDWEHAIQRVVRQIEGVIGEAPAKPSAAVASGKEAEGPAETASSARPPASTAGAGPTAKKSPMPAILSAAAAVIVVLAGLLAWQLWPKQTLTPAPAPVAATASPSAAPNPSPLAPPSALPPPVAAAPVPPATSAPASEPIPAPAATQPAPAPQPEPPKPAASNAPPKTFRDCPNCPEMVVIPAGSFQMGAAPGENERLEVSMTESGRDEPQHQVTITKPFALGKFDITRAEFAVFANETGFRPRPGCMTVVGNTWTPQPRASWEEPGYPQTDKDPVVCMNEIEIGAYLGWLHLRTGKDYRLPSEAEWEYAERGGTTTTFYWGDDIKDACIYENVGDESYAAKYGVKEPIPCNDGFADPAPVGSFKPNPFGLYDMAGNVFVLIADCWNESYIDAPSDGSAWMTGDCIRHVARKASFGNPHPSMFRAAQRESEGTVVRRNRHGFRVALSLP